MNQRGSAGSDHTRTAITAMAAPMHDSVKRRRALRIGGNVEAWRFDSTIITATVKAASLA